MKYNDDGLSSLIAGAMFATALIALVVVGFGLVLVVLAGGFVFSVLKVRPNSRPIWISLLVFGLALLLAIFSGGQSTFLIFCLVSFVGVLLACLVEKVILHPQLFAATNEQSVVTDLIRQQWWDEPDDEDDNVQQQQQRVV